MARKVEDDAPRSRSEIAREREGRRDDASEDADGQDDTYRKRWWEPFVGMGAPKGGGRSKKSDAPPATDEPDGPDGPVTTGDRPEPFDSWDDFQFDYPVGATTIEEFPAEGPGSIPTVVRRGLARTADAIIGVIVPTTLFQGAVFALLGTEEADGTLVPPFLPFVAATLVAIAIGFAYETVMVARYGCTLGKKYAGLEVVDVESGGAVSYANASKRVGLPLGVFTVLLILAPGLATIPWAVVYLSAAWVKGLQRGWPDKMADTIVLRTQ